MFILYFDNECWEYHISRLEHWTDYRDFRAAEGFWLVPGTDPEDPLYIWQ